MAPVKRKIPMHESNGAKLPVPLSKRRKDFPLPLPQRSSGMGCVYVVGHGDMGQLGLGDEVRLCKRPTLLANWKNVVNICAGGMHSLVLTSDGKLFSFGCNDEGALGRDTEEDGFPESEPHLVPLPRPAIKISAGDSHSACLLEDGRVFAWGSFRSSMGSIGLTPDGVQRKPLPILPHRICVDIASGNDHLLVMAVDGDVITVGCGEQGQLGRVSMRSTSGEGRTGFTKMLQPKEVLLKRHHRIDAIWASNHCSFMRESGNSGNLWVFGLNNYHQLLVGDDSVPNIVPNPRKVPVTDVKQIAGGQHHTILLKTNGTCYAIGCNHYGCLGLGNVGSDVSSLRPITSLNGMKIVKIACGNHTSFALTENGVLFAWGMGTSHQLGTGNDEDAVLPILLENETLRGKRVLDVSSGGLHSMFLVEESQDPTEGKADGEETEDESESEVGHVPSTLRKATSDVKLSDSDTAPDDK